MAINAQLPNHRTAGVRALHRFLALPVNDAEERAARKLLRRLDIREAIQR